jgi:hypothetical protein
LAELRYLLGDHLVDRGRATNLDPEPHPTSIEWAESQTSGEGHPLPSGFRRVVWNFEGQIISAATWDSYQVLLHGGTYGIVYIRTRTPDISGDQYEYKTYKAIMSRPIGTPAPGGRFTEVSLEFAIIEEAEVGYPQTSTTSTSTTLDVDDDHVHVDDNDLDVDDDHVHVDDNDLDVDDDHVHVDDDHEHNDDPFPVRGSGAPLRVRIPRLDGG